MRYVPRECPAYSKRCGEFRKPKYFKPIYRSVHRQQFDQWVRRVDHKVRQEGRLQLRRSEQVL